MRFATASPTGKPPHGRGERFDHGSGHEFARAGTPAAALVSEITQRLGLRLNYARVIGITATIAQILI